MRHCTPERIAEIRAAVAAEIAKAYPRSICAIARSLHANNDTIYRHCRDLLDKKVMKHTSIWAPKRSGQGVYIQGRLLEAAGARPGSIINVRVVGKRRMIVTASEPECNSLAIQRWGKVGS